MPKKSSHETALRKMNRAQLVEIIYALQQHEQKLIEERDALRKQLEKVGSSASVPTHAPDPSASISGIIEQAQLTAEKYLESVRDMNIKAQQANTQMVEAAERQAEAILKDAELQAQHMLNKASTKAQNLSESAQGQSYDLDLALEDFEELLEEAEGYIVPEASEYLDNSDEDFAYGHMPKLPYEAQFIEGLSDTEYEEEYDTHSIEAISSDDGFEASEDFALSDTLETSDDLSINDDFDETEEAFEEVAYARPNNIVAPTVTITLGEELFWEDEPEDDISGPLSEDISYESTSKYDALEEYSEEDQSSYDQNIEHTEIFDAASELLDSPDVSPNISPSELYSEDFIYGEEAIAPDERDGLDVIPDIITSTDRELDEAEETVHDLEDATEDIDSDNGHTEEVASEEDDKPVVQAEAPTTNSLGDTEAFAPLDPTISGILCMTKAERKAAKKAAKMARKAAKHSGNPRLAKLNGEGLAKDESPDTQNPKPAEDAQSKEELLNHAKMMLKTKAVPEIMQSSYENFTEANHLSEAEISDFDMESCFDDEDIKGEYAIASSDKQAVK